MFDKKLWIFDGAIGTELYERGFYINRPFEELNLSHPSDVQKVHEAYIEAGAQVLTTNTFSITRPQLQKFDIAEKQKDLLESAISLANQARKNNSEILIGLSIGPIGVLIEPLGPTSHEEAQNFFAEVANIAVEHGHFDFYNLETFSNISEIRDAIIGLRSADKTRPILASVTVHSSQNDFINDFIQTIGHRDDVQALGFNCSQGPSDLLTVLKRVRPLVDKPIIIQPNAGVPNHVNGRYFYMTSPDYLGKYAKRFVEAGAAGVGGCCGTGPAHILAVSSALHMASVRQIANAKSRIEISSETKKQRKSLEERPDSDVGKLLSSGRKVFSIEVIPPRGCDLSQFISQIESIEKAGISFVNVPDGARASTRVSSLHLAAHINRDSRRKIKVLPHFTTRDRNLIALQSDLLGAFVNGVRDILIVTGDPPKLGNNRDATAVYDIDSIGLTYLLDCLNRGLSPTGDSLGQGTGYGIGVATNPTAVNLEVEAQRFRYKCESGADFAISQPIFDPDSFFRWRDQLKDSWKPHLVGIWPLVSLRNAEFLANEVPGIHVPKNILEKMHLAGNDSNEAIKRGLEIARNCMEKMSSSCEGFCVSAPLGKVDVALELFKARP